LGSTATYECTGKVALHILLRITPRHVQLAVRNDQELYNFLNAVTIAAGGVVPIIFPALLLKKSKKEAKA